MKIYIFGFLSFFLFPFLLFSQESNIDSLKSLLKEEASTTARVDFLNEISTDYLKSDYEKSIIYAKKAFELSESLDYNKGKSKSLCNLGKAYMYLGLNDQAIIYLTDGLKVYKELQDSTGIVCSYRSLGSVYWFLNEFDLALLYYKKTNNYYEQRQDSVALISSYMNLGICYYIIQEEDSANYFLDKAIEYSFQLEQYNSVGIILMNKASIYFDRSNFNKTGDILQEIETKYLDQFSIGAKGNFYSFYCDYYVAINDYQKANSYLSKLFLIATQSKSMEHLKYYYDSKFHLDSLSGNYKEAISDLIKYNQYQDSLVDLNYKSKIENLGKLREVEKKETEISLLKKDNQLKDIKISESRKLQGLYFLLSLLLFILVLIIYRSFRLNKKKNNLLFNQNEELIAQKEEIECTSDQLQERNKELLDLNILKDKSYSIISHDLRGSVGTIKGFSDLLNKKYDVIEESKKRKYIKLISQASESTLELLSSLLEWSRSQQGKVIVNQEKINLYEITSNVLHFTAPMYEKKEIEVINKLGENTNALGDKDLIFTILRNLVSNAIKFTQAGGKISVFSEINDKHYVIHVKDNGVGISKDTQSKLFSKGEVISTLGTENESGTGMGLLLCKEFITKHNQKIGVESSLGYGSDFWFTLEISN